jgi:hypothetical protein
MAKPPYKLERSVPIPKAKLHPNPWNPNHMKPNQAKGVEESLQWVGQVLDLLVRPHTDVDGEYQIIDGEHRFNVIGDTVYCTIIHGLSEAEAKKLTIVMNETRGEADKIELAQLLKDIWVDMGDDTGWALPYDDTELTELVNLADVDWGNFEDAFEPDDPTEPQDDRPAQEIDCVCPECGHKFIRQL